MHSICFALALGLLVTVGAGCQMFQPGAPESIVAPGEIGEAPQIAAAADNRPPLVFGAGDALGRTLYAQYIAFVRVQLTPRIQLAESPLTPESD